MESDGGRLLELPGTAATGRMLLELLETEAAISNLLGWIFLTQGGYWHLHFLKSSFYSSVSGDVRSPQEQDRGAPPLVSRGCHGHSALNVFSKSFSRVQV